MSFKEWEQQLIGAPGYPNNKESRLAIQTLKTCITESPIKDDKIAQNGYALFDYVMLCYFIFRAKLCADFPQRFVEQYDNYTQNLLSLYCCHFFDISQETTGRLIVSRAKEYERIVREDNAIYKVTAALTQHIEKDFEGTPEYEGVLLTGIIDNFELHIKLFDYIQATLTDLDRHASALQAETVKSNSQPTSEPLRVNHDTAQSAIKKYEAECKRAEKERLQRKKKAHADKKWIKVNTILTVVCLVLFIASLIGMFVYDTMMTNARFHYDETCELVDGSLYRHTVGCGLETCRYCQGNKERHFGENVSWNEYYEFGYYYHASETYWFFESCVNVFLISLIVLVIVLLISIVFRYKFTIQITRKEEPNV